MKRPTDKLLKDMSKEELSMEAEWHDAEAVRLLKEVEQLQSKAVSVAGGPTSDETLKLAGTLEEEAAAHHRQSNLLSTLMVGRLMEKEQKNSAGSESVMAASGDR
jgi:hypothetical protein